MSLRVATLSLFFLAISVLSSQAEPPPKWEYKVVNKTLLSYGEEYQKKIDELLKAGSKEVRKELAEGARANYAKALNDLGAEGWELCGIPGSDGEMIFKRKLP